MRKLFAKLVAGCPLQAMHDLTNRQSWRERGEQMNVVWHHNQIKYLTAKFPDVFRQQSGKTHANSIRKDWTSIFRTPDQVVVDVIRCVPSLFAHSKRIMP